MKRIEELIEKFNHVALTVVGGLVVIALISELIVKVMGK